MARTADLGRDLRHGVRVLRRSPGLTAVVVATLGLGMGAAVALFAVVDGVLLRPLPFADPGRLVVLQETNPPRWPAGSIAVAPGKYFDWVAQARSFENLVLERGASYALGGAERPVRVSAARVTANALATLGVRLWLGRDFAGDEEGVVLLGHGLWARELGGRPEVVGRSVRLDGRPFTVVGVLPPGFDLDGP